MTVIALVAFACCIIFSLFYWHVFHAVLIRSIRYRLFAIRDDARMAAADLGLVESFAFRRLEKLINDSIRFFPYVSLVSFIGYFLQKPSLTPDEILRFEREAPREFLQLRDKAVKSMLMTMMLNSPWIVVIASLIVTPMWAAGRISGLFLCRNAEIYVARQAEAFC